MNSQKIILTAIFILISTVFCFSQISGKTKPVQDSFDSKQKTAKSSSAYAEILLRKTELEAELEGFSPDYTEEFPKIKEIKFASGLLQKELDKILAANQAETGKLTLALGKLIVRKVEIETDLWNLRRQYSDDHPEVKRAKRKVAVFERAVREILPQ